MSSVEILFDVWFFLVGTVVGSFANVCIHRLPRGESVVAPRSRCPACGRGIAFYDNVPIVSWLLLRGRCRRCGASISPRYPLIEAGVGMLFLLSALLWGPTPLAASAALLSAAGVICVATDLESRVLPDEVTLGTMATGILLAGLRDVLARSPQVPFHLVGSHVAESVLGAVFGALLLIGVRAAYHAVRAMEGLGLGDVKMIAMVGAFTGPVGALLTLFFASLAGSLVGIGLALGRRLTWARAARLSAAPRDRVIALAERLGLLLDEGGRVAAAGPRWREIPGAAEAGASLSSSGPAAREVVAFARLARRRARAGRPSEYSRLAADDGEDFFRVLAARAVPVSGGVLVLLSRADIPFGVFLAFGSWAAFAAGRAVMSALFGDLPVMLRLLP
jgi:leader peptidase (prepilin peptidase)/N-methyltransferase